MDGKVTGGLEASDRIFKAPANEHIVNETLNWYLASARQGNACAKTRAEVAGSGRKPWRQKGTGRARIGDIRAPHWRKGGVVFAPKRRDYSFSLPIKIRKAALRVVLSDKVKNDKLKIVDSIPVPSGKTKDMSKLLKTFGSGDVLIVLSQMDLNVARASSNIKGVMVSTAQALNIYDLLKHNEVIITKHALSKLEEVLK